MKQHNKILCFSGGLDSVIAWWALDKPICVYFKLGHKYEEKELNCIKNLQDKFGMKIIISDALKLGEFEGGENAYIPNRNLHFAAVASNYAPNVFIIGVKGDRVGDKNPQAYEGISAVLNLIKKPNTPTIKVDSPFWKMTKTDIIRWLVNEIGKKKASEVYKTSVSCYDDKTLGQCGRCKSCFRKFISMTYAGINCTDWFESDILNNPYISQYVEEMSKEDSPYDERRIKETREVLKKFGLWDKYERN